MCFEGEPSTESLFKISNVSSTGGILAVRTARVVVFPGLAGVYWRDGEGWR